MSREERRNRQVETNLDKPFADYDRDPEALEDLANYEDWETLERDERTEAQKRERLKL
ncbi:hypothetical protein [Paenibacillus senegalimassiliensis]|uniref:hypothetical protein n=1 Tax=Paenibacillus senegalimassiliensis TaxID=1737426 RepID=UPI000A678343|nr:hypothetical protein [Paenibacillus senegalimassiliensis]